MNNAFSSWSDLIQGVQQGSALRSLLFNIYLNHLFFTLEDQNLCNFINGTTSHACDKSIQKVLN